MFLGTGAFDGWYLSWKAQTGIRVCMLDATVRSHSYTRQAVSYENDIAEQPDIDWTMVDRSARQCKHLHIAHAIAHAC